MSRTIRKYELCVTDVQNVEMPTGAQLLTVDNHPTYYYGEHPRSHLTLWASVDPEAPKVDRRIAVVGTGQSVSLPEDNAIYIGTALCPPFVWHVFDGGEVEHG